MDVVIIAFNEAMNLPHCLAAVVPWARRVVVVDSGSTDGTQDLARAAGAEVVHHPWEGYAAQKNWALTHLDLASAWTLIVDADEIVTPRLRERLNAIVHAPPASVPENGFFINRLTYFLDRPIRHCGYYPSWNLRLFKRGRGRYEDRRVHEHIIIDDPLGFVDEPMLHHDRRGLEHFYAKHNRYSTLEATQLFHEITAGVDPVSRGGQAANVTAETRRRRWLKRHVTRFVPLPGIWRFLYMYVFRLGVLDGKVGFEFCRLIAGYDAMVALKLRAMLANLDHGQLASHAALAIEERVQPSFTVLRSRSTLEPQPATDAASKLNIDNYLQVRLAPRVRTHDRVVVTGGSGFIGTNLVELYRTAGASVLSLDLAPPRDPRHRDLWRKVDLVDSSATKAAFQDFNPTVVFHLAARTDLDESEGIEGYQVNRDGVSNVLAALELASDVRLLVMTSSQLVCEPGYAPSSDTDYRPHTSYGRSKVLTEQLTRSWRNPKSIPWVLIRPTSIWGPWFDVPYRDFFLTIAKRRYVHQRGIDPLRSFGFVGNAVYQYLAYTLIDPALIDRHTFYLCDYEPVRVRAWANLIGQEMGTRPLREVPLGVLQLAGKGGDLARGLGWREPPLTSFRLKNLISDNYTDMQEVAALLGPLPYTVEEGVALTVEWLRRQRLVRPRRRIKAPIKADR